MKTKLTFDEQMECSLEHDSTNGSITLYDNGAVAFQGQYKELLERLKGPHGETYQPFSEPFGYL